MEEGTRSSLNRGSFFMVFCYAYFMTKMTCIFWLDDMQNAVRNMKNTNAITQTWYLMKYAWMYYMKQDVWKTVNVQTIQEKIEIQNLNWEQRAHALQSTHAIDKTHL